MQLLQIPVAVRIPQCLLERGKIKAILVPNLNIAIIIIKLLQCCEATVKPSVCQQTIRITEPWNGLGWKGS